MGLFDSIQKDYITARKERNAFLTKVLSLLISDLKYDKIDKQKEEMEDGDVIAVIQKSIKQKNEALAEFDKAGRTDLADEARQELEILGKYMPAQLSEEDLKRIVQETVKSTGASNPSEMGKVMGAVMAKVKGQADGNLVRKLVTEALNS